MKVSSTNLHKDSLVSPQTPSSDANEAGAKGNSVPKPRRRSAARETAKKDTPLKEKTPRRCGRAVDKSPAGRSGITHPIGKNDKSVDEGSSKKGVHTIIQAKGWIHRTRKHGFQNGEYLLGDIYVFIEEYVDDQTLIPKCTSLVICRFPCKPIVLFQETADEE
ncbi:hypothetical protein Tco_1483662 [Tanacetum coccineum]